MKMSIKVLLTIAAVFSAVQINNVAAVDLATTISGVLASLIGAQSSLPGLPTTAVVPTDLLSNFATVLAVLNELNAAAAAGDATCLADLNTAFGPALTNLKSATDAYSSTLSLTSLPIIGSLFIPQLNSNLIDLNQAAVAVSSIPLPATCPSP